MKKVDIDSKVFLKFYTSGRLHSLGINIEKYNFESIYPHEIIQFSTICKTFLQGRFTERKIIFTDKIDELNTEDGVIELHFTKTSILHFAKISENNTVYLSCGVVSNVAIAESENNKNIILAHEEMINQEVSLKMPEKPIRFSQFMCQYYLDVLQKVSYVWT